MAVAAQHTPYFQTDFPAEEFIARRAKIAQAIGPHAVAVLRGAIATGAFDAFRQDNDFYYFSGVEVPHAYLSIEGGTGRSRLYLPPADPKHQQSEGAELTTADADLACRLTGVDETCDRAELERALSGAGEIYLLQSPAEGRQACRDTLLHASRSRREDPWYGRASDEVHFAGLIADAQPGVKIRDLSPLVDQLRIVKSERELTLLRRAGQLSALAVVEAMRATRPRVYEYHLAAIGDYIYAVAGTRGGGYRPIVASGANIWHPHYFRNSAPLEPGELVLMDYAPDVGNYTSDIGRMWPVDGKYRPWQRELYGFVVEYHKTLLELIRPGLTAQQIHAEAAARMRPVIEARRWSKPSFRQGAEGMLQFAGHLSHGVGMAVHDVGDYKARPLEPGVVFALDPQMWVPEERLYIRVEDTVAVTADGCESLTRLAPLELDAVERTIAEGPTVPTAAALESRYDFVTARRH